MSAPPFSYFGGKTLLAPQIVRMLPKHRHYVEPFAGSLAVLLSKPRSPMETVNDLEGDLMTFWRVLRDQSDDLIRVCELTPHSRAEYRVSYERDDLDDLEKARRVWVLLTQGRTGTFKATGWRFSIDEQGRACGVTGDLAGYVKRMPAVAARLAGVSLESRPALEVVAAYGAHPDVLIYADPPYLGETRNGRNYGTDMAGVAEHQELAAALNRCEASVVLSGYDSDLYVEMYDGWHSHRIGTFTGQGGTRAQRTEVLWSNRPLGVQTSLFDEVAS